MSMSMMENFILSASNDELLFEMTKQDFDVVLNNNSEVSSEFADKYKQHEVIKEYKIHPLQKIYVLEDRILHNGTYRFVFVFRYKKRYFVFMWGAEQ